MGKMANGKRHGRKLIKECRLLKRERYRDGFQHGGEIDGEMIERDIGKMFLYVAYLDQVKPRT